MALESFVLVASEVSQSIHSINNILDFLCEIFFTIEIGFKKLPNKSISLCSFLSFTFLFRQKYFYAM